MKIVQISPGIVRLPPLLGGGAELTELLWSEGLSALGNEVTVLDRQYVEHEANDEINGVKIVRLKSRYINRTRIECIPKLGFLIKNLRFNINLFYFILSVIQYIDTIEVEVIQTHVLIQAITLLLLRPKKRLKIYFVSHAPFWSKQPWNFRIWWGAVRETILMKVIGGVIAHNKFEQERFVALGINPKKVWLVWPPVKTNLFNANSYGHTDENPIKVQLLFVGRVVEDKGVEYLVKAINILATEGMKEKIHLSIVGPLGSSFDTQEQTLDKYVKKIQKYITSHKLEEVIEITGSVDSQTLLEYFSNSNIFLLPSLAEGTPGVVIQAMSFSKPIIASSVGGILDEVKDNYNGFLVEPKNALQLAGKIRLLVENQELRLCMGKRGRELAVEKFDYLSVAKQLLMSYKREQ